MQHKALAQSGRLGLDRNILEAIYFGLHFYRLKQRADVSNVDALQELGRIFQKLQALPTTATEIEAAIAQELADAVEHDRPDSSEANFLRFLAQIAKG